MKAIDAKILYAISYHFKGNKGRHQDLIINEMVRCLPYVIDNYKINTPPKNVSFSVSTM